MRGVRGWFKKPYVDRDPAAAHAAVQAGLAQHRDEVANLEGGTAAWSRAGLPVVAKGGRPGRVA